MRRFFFALLLLLCTEALDAAIVAGKVGFITKRGQKPVPQETMVWLEPLVGKHVPQPPATFQVVTRDKKLFPHVLAVPIGSTLQFPNEDSISHNLFSLSTGNTFDLGLYRKGAGKQQTFDAPGRVTIYCNVHPNMSAVVLVVPMRHYTLADAAGNYSLPDVAPGKYRLLAWNEQGGTRESAIEVTEAGTIVGGVALTIDGRSYRAAQHTNKFGKPYEGPPSLMDAGNPTAARTSTDY